MKNRKTGRGHEAAPRTPPPAFHLPFAGLSERLGVTAGDTAQSPPAAPEGAAPPPRRPGDPGPVAPARAVVRLERKGRGGKEATIVEKLALTSTEREAWLRQLKRALGCGGTIERDALVLQGDLRGRVKAFLEARGVRNVTLG